MTVRNRNSAKTGKEAFVGLFIKCILVLLLVSLPETMFSQTNKQKGNGLSDETLIDQYIQSKNGAIIFDAANIKQFWISKTVAGLNNNINIILTDKNNGSFESIPLKIQLANVGLIQDCKIDIISDTADASFTIADANLKPIASSAAEEDFLHYHIYSSSFHLADTQDFLFNLIFKTKNDSNLSIKKIILSFSNNKSYLSSPGSLHITKNNIVSPRSTVDEMGGNAFSLTGTTSLFFSQNSILVGDNSISYSVTVKNISDTPTTVYIGYVPYTASGRQIDNRAIPYKNNKVLKVVSSEPGSNKLTVDGYPEWTKGCFVALNAKEDLSDFPNCSFIDGSIVEIKKIDEGHVEIIFDKPIRTQITKDTLVRIQSPHGSTYLCLFDVL